MSQSLIGEAVYRPTINGQDFIRRAASGLMVKGLRIGGKTASRFSHPISH
jgi:hypothetical protein